MRGFKGGWDEFITDMAVPITSEFGDATVDIRCRRGERCLRLIVKIFGARFSKKPRASTCLEAEHSSCADCDSEGEEAIVPSCQDDNENEVNDGFLIHRYV